MTTVNEHLNRDDCRAAILNNLTYRSEASLSKAFALVEACEAWLMFFAFEESKNGESSLRINTARAENILKTVQTWIASQPQPRSNASGNVVRLSVEDFRR